MDFLRVIAALALPWLIGTLIVHYLAPSLEVGRRALVLGYGYLAGVLAITLLMRASDAIGFRLELVNLLSLLLPLSGVVALMAFQIGRPVGGRWLSKAYLELPMWQKILATALLSLAAMRLGGFWLEVYWRPLYPWDAFMHWATKARVWTDAQAILPFVDYDQWLALRGEAVFTDNHPDYPIMTPLLQTWMNLVLGRWDDALMNLPWPLLAFAGGLAYFAQARLAGVGPLTTAVFTYLLLSLPLLNLQIALAGYADIFLGFFYLAAVMAFYQWCSTRDYWQGILSFVFALGCLLIKNEGFFWLLTFLPGIAALLLPRRWFWLLAGLGILAVLAILAFLPTDIKVAGHTLEGLNLHFRTEALVPLLQSLFIFSNWHLLFWLAIALLLTGILKGYLTGSPWPPALFALAIVVATATSLLLILFLFTKFSGGAIRHTAAGRITLQIAPALCFFSMLLFQNLNTKSHIRLIASAHSPDQYRHSQLHPPTPR